MIDKKNDTLISLINEHYDTLPKSEKKLADVLLDFPGEIAAYTATELAKIAGVSKAAATRFFKRLGFANFEEARRLARHSKNWGSPLYLQSKSHTDVTSDQYFQQYFQEESANLADTLHNLSASEMNDVCQALISAKRLWIVGFRNSHYIAAYARWQFIQFRPNVFLLPSGTGETLGENLAELLPDDLVMVIGVRRRVTNLPKIMKTIHQKNVPILYLTDPTASKTSEYAKWVFKCTVANSFLFDSYTSLMSLTRFLAIESFRRSGKSGRDHLKSIENLHKTLDEFE